MVYIKTNSNKEVMLIHFKPFDDRNGMHKTIDELKEEGYLIESYSEPEVPEGKTISKTFYDEVNNKFTYEYIDTPVVVTLEELKKQNDELTLLINTLLGV